MITLLCILLVIIAAIAIAVTIFVGGVYILFRYVLPIFLVLVLILALIGVVKLIFH